jgi:uncharacterized protein (TIGR03083 family)
MTTDMLTYERLTTAIRDEAGAFVDTVAGVDLAATVPTCPEWTVRELVHHVGRAFYWSAANVTSGADTMVPFDDVTDGVLPADHHADWLRSGAERLVTAVTEVGPETSVWSWAQDKRSIFWLRRITHETVVHRADAAAAAGRDFDVPLDVAVDAVTEWLEILTQPAAIMFAPGLGGTGQTLHFHATDVTDGGEWLIRRTPDGPTLAYEHVKADVAVRAPAGDLLLALTGRKPLDAVEVIGDTELLAHWREHTKF